MARSDRARPAAAEPRPTTAYVILRRLSGARMDELPPDVGDEHQSGVYVAVGTERANSDDAAIGAYRGRWAATHNGAELDGAFRAVSWRAWKGLVEYEAPAHVPMQRRLIEEDA